MLLFINNLYCTVNKKVCSRRNIYSNYGKYTRCWALLGGGSQSNFMTHDLASKLGLQAQRANTRVSAIGNLLYNVAKMVKITISSTHNKYLANESSLLVDKITDRLPQIPFDFNQLNILSNIQLADKKMYLSQPIDVGPNIFYNILYVGQPKILLKQVHTKIHSPCC